MVKMTTDCPVLSHHLASGSRVAPSWLGDAFQEYEKWQSPVPWSQPMFQHTIRHLRVRGINSVSIVTLNEKNKQCVSSDACEALFRVLAVQVDLESWETTDSDRCDGHQGCEIGITTVGRAEKERRGKNERLEGQMRRGQDRGVRQGEYIIILWEGREKGERRWGETG